MFQENTSAPPPETSAEPILADDTPVKSKSTSHGSYRGTDLPTARRTMMLDLGPSIDVIPLGLFEKHVLPPLDLDVKKVKTSLERSGHLVAEGFRSMLKDANSEAARETVYYGPLKDIHDEVRKAAMPLRGAQQSGPILEYRICGDRKPVSDRDSTSRPDGYEILVQDHDLHLHSCHFGPRVKDDWLDIPRCDEYKKDDNDSDRIDNAEKICWSAHHILRNDPRRRFVFGLTVEKTTARIWFFNRQTVIISEPFDYMKKPEHFIHLVLSLSFATPAQLGYDMTMTLCWNKNRKLFDYEIDLLSKTYRTTRIISDYSADALKGRGTRVFEALEVENGKTKGIPIVIKDTWMDQDRDTEGQIMKNLLANATEEQKQYFLTVIAHGYVQSENEPDNTCNIHMRGLDVSRDRMGQLPIVRDYKDYPQVQKKQKTRSLGLPVEFDVVPKSSAGHVYSPKIHYRIIFKEVCVSLEEERQWMEVFRVLSEAVKGIRVMYDLGRWVHRDLSTGNILIYRGQVKLADLEFAKIIGSGGKHPMRTGTLDFMSCEVQALMYLFEPPQPPLPPRRAAKVSDVFNESGGSISGKPLPARFVHHSLHDLESLWWIFMRFLFWYVPQGAEYTAVALENQRRCAQHDVFPHVLNAVRRQNIFVLKLGFLSLEPSLVHDFCRNKLLEHGELMRSYIIDAFKAAEHEIESRGIRYDTFPEAFNNIQDLFEDGHRLEELASCNKIVHILDKLQEMKRTEKAVEQQPATADGSANDKRLPPDEIPIEGEHPKVNKRTRILEAE